MEKVREDMEVRTRGEIGVAEFETVRRERCDRERSRDRDQVIFHHWGGIRKATKKCHSKA